MSEQTTKLPLTDLRAIIASALLLHDTGEPWSEAVEVGEENGWLSAADAVIEVLKSAQYPEDAAVEALSDAEIIERCKLFVSHEEDGRYVLTFGVPLWGRVLRILTSQSFGDADLKTRITKHFEQDHELCCPDEEEACTILEEVSATLQDSKQASGEEPEHTVRYCAGDRKDVDCIDGLDCSCRCHHKWNLTVDGLLRFMEFYKDGYAVVDAAVRARIGWPE